MDALISLLTTTIKRKKLFSLFINLNILTLGLLLGCFTTNVTAQICDVEVIFENPRCGDNDGTILAIPPEPGDFQYFYQLMAADGTMIGVNASFFETSFDELPPGMYFLYFNIIGAPECALQIPIDLINDDADCTPPCEATFNPVASTCGESNAALDILVEDEGTMYSIQVAGPNGYSSSAATMGMPITLNMLMAGDYEVTISSNVLGDDCTQTHLVTIENDDADCVSCDVDIVYFNPTCGNNNGIIEANPPIVGDFQYFYQLLTPDGEVLAVNASFFEDSFNELPPGEYIVDFNVISTGCNIQTPVELINDDSDCTPSCSGEFTIANSTCGEYNASIGFQIGSADELFGVTVAGPNGYYSAASTMGMPLSFGNLLSGEYEVTVTSFVLGQDCEETYPITIEDDGTGCLPEFPCEVEVIYENPMCGNNDGTILAIPPIQGELQYIYELFDQNGELVKINASFFEVLFDELPNGLYNLKFTVVGTDCVVETPVELIDDMSDCCSGNFNAGSISTESNLEICTIGDAYIDTVIVNRSATAMGGDFAYFVTNSNGSNILMGPVFSNILTFEGAMPEVCRIYGVAYCGELTYDEHGGIETVAATDTFGVTNWLPVQVYDCSNDPSPNSCNLPFTGTISTTANKTYCLENGPQTIGPFPMEITNTPFQNVAYVVTNAERSMVLSGPYTSHNFMVNADPYTDYRILGIVYDGQMPNIVAGQPLASISSPNCYDYTNSVMIYAFNCDNGTQLCDHITTGEIGTESLKEFCITGDNQVNQVIIDADEARATHSGYIFYTPDYVTIGGPFPGNIFTFEDYGYTGPLFIARIAWEGEISVPLGQPVSSISSSQCYQFSNAVCLNLKDCSDMSICEILDNGKIKTSSPTVVCAGTGDHLVEVEPYDYQSTNYAFIVTNADGSQIVQGPLHADGNILFDLSQAGAYRIRGVAYEGDLNVPIGQPISALSSTMCYQYTFGIDVTVLNEVGCEARLAATQAVEDEFTIGNKVPTTLDILANDLNPCEALPVIAAEPTRGTVTINDNGSVSYLPEANFTGTVEFIYLLCCEEICRNQKVVLHITEEEINLFDLLVVPNVITPNHDGINDAFTIKGLEKQLADYNVGLMIYDRYGNVIHTEENFEQINQWDAQVYGTDLAAGTYFYLLTLEENPDMTKAGFIEIRR